MTMKNLDPENLLKMDNDVNKPCNILTIDLIKTMVNTYPNDMDLGFKVRKLINSLDVKS